MAPPAAMPPLPPLRAVAVEAERSAAAIGAAAVGGAIAREQAIADDERSRIINGPAIGAPAAGQFKVVERQRRIGMDIKKALSCRRPAKRTELVPASIVTLFVIWMVCPAVRLMGTGQAGDELV